MPELSRLEKAEYLATMRRENKLNLFTPYPKQREFIAMGRTYLERMLSAGNQAGKCTGYDCEIDHPDGTSTKAGVLFDQGKPFDVLSWDGRRQVVKTVSVLI